MRHLYLFVAMVASAHILAGMVAVTLIVEGCTVGSPFAPTTNVIVAISSIQVTNYVVTTLAGSGTAGYAEGTGAAASFNTPNHLTLDGVGNL